MIENLIEMRTKRLDRNNRNTIEALSNSFSDGLGSSDVESLALYQSPSNKMEGLFCGSSEILSEIHAIIRNHTN